MEQPTGRNKDSSEKSEEEIRESNNKLFKTKEAACLLA